MDANQEEARKVFAEYNCNGVPHLLFVDQEGNEVDRIIGFLPPGEYLARIQDIRENKHTLDDYLTRYKNGEVTSDIIAGIAMKFEDRGEDDKANDYYTILVKDFPDNSSEYFQRGIFFSGVSCF